MTASFEQALTTLEPVQVQFLYTLLAKGFSFGGSGMKNGELCFEVRDEGSEVVIHPSGQVELFTEFLDPNDKTDLGHHVWTLNPNASNDDVTRIVEELTTITGNNS